MYIYIKIKEFYAVIFFLKFNQELFHVGSKPAGWTHRWEGIL